jgi:hypothetical protein
MKHIILVLFTVYLVPAQTGTVDYHIKVDQFGYLADAEKVAVISEPVSGYNAPLPFTPAATYQVRNADDDGVAWSGPVAAWKNGTVQTQSGDRAWWFDFSELETPGSYYLYDPDNNASSVTFEISDTVYQTAARHALRTFYYQRCGVPKSVPHAHASWVDNTACHVHAQQDLDCRLVANPFSSVSKYLMGGWHDAGDHNKYINFADGVVHNLLFAWGFNPAGWGDDLGIPESGNGAADILDEVKWELDWFLRMQNSDGSVLHKISVTSFASGSPPSTDTAPRRYAPATASATVSACGAFAHGAVVFSGLSHAPYQAYADTLKTAAVAAWDWLDANPQAIPSVYDNNGFVNAAAEDDAYTQKANRIMAAAWLAMLTGESKYSTFTENNLDSLHLFQWGAFEYETDIQETMLAYAASSASSTAAADRINNRFRNSMNGKIGTFQDSTDAYRSHMSDATYHWGSNSLKSAIGAMHSDMNHFALSGTDSSRFKNCALAYLNYIHGVNPISIVYLSNMNSYGAEHSVDEFYHGWFTDGSNWDNVNSSLGPAPGFLVGGPNRNFAPDASYSGPPLEPPQNQPPQKSYLTWNTSWPENSWEITENSIVYQGAYIKLISAFLGKKSPVHSTQNLILKQDPVIRIYPNPLTAGSRLILSHATKVNSISLYDIRGKKVQELEGRKKGTFRIFHINRNLVPGCYMVQYTLKGKKACSRIVVLR